MSTQPIGIPFVITNCEDDKTGRTCKNYQIDEKGNNLWVGTDKYLPNGDTIFTSPEYDKDGKQIGLNTEHCNPSGECKQSYEEIK